MEFGVFVAAWYAVFMFCGFAPRALGERFSIVHGAASVAFGVIAASIMRPLELWVTTPHSDAPLQLFQILDPPMWAAVILWLWAYLISKCFAGWCLAIPDRDIMVRRQFMRAVDGYRPKIGWRFFTVQAWSHFLSLVFLISTPLLFAMPHPQHKLAVAIPLLTFGLGGIFTSITLGRSPLYLLRVTWRALVVFHTYDVPQPGGARVTALGVFTFPAPFRDLRLRVLCTAVVVAVCSIALSAATGWPGPADFREVWTKFDLGVFFLWLVVNAARFVVIGAAFLAWIFLTLTGIIGPLCGLIYQDFAEGAVKLAERSSK